MYLPKNMGPEEKQASEKATQAKAYGNDPANLPGVPLNIPGKTTPLAWFWLCLNWI